MGKHLLPDNESGHTLVEFSRHAADLPRSPVTIFIALILFIAFLLFVGQ
jgi:hypothetical protein